MTGHSSENGGYRWVILGAVFLLQGIVSIAAFSFGPLAPFLRDTFGITRVQVGLFSSLLLLAQVFFSVPTGWLIDRYGVRRLILLGPGAFGLLFALLSQAPDIGVAYIVVSLTGLGYLFIVPTTTMALVHWFTLRSRATAISIKQSALTVGSAAGAILIPSLSLWLGWRSVVAIMGAAAFTAAVFCSAIYRKSASQPSAGQGQAPALSTFRQVFANKSLLRLGLAGSIYIALQFSISSYLVLQLVEVRQMSVVTAGTFLMATNLAGAVGRVLWGVISDRSFRGERKPVLVIIGTVSGITAIVLSFIGATMSWWMLYLAFIVLGATAFGWNGVQLTFATEISGEGNAATGLGLVITMHSIGGLVGPPLFGYIVDRTSSYEPAWLIFGVLTVVAALSIILIKTPHPAQSPASLSENL